MAAAAEELSISVLHYDADFDLIAKVTGQASQWVVPTGSVRNLAPAGGSWGERITVDMASELVLRRS